MIEVRKVIQKEEVSDVLLAAFAAMGFALSARLLLLLAMLGGFALSYLAMERQSAMALWVLGTYCCLVLIPMVYLEISSKRQREG